MSEKPKIDNAKTTLLNMDGDLEIRYHFQCQWCGSDYWVEEDTEKEAMDRMVKDGVRRVHHEDTIYLMCPPCVGEARKNQLDG